MILFLKISLAVLIALMGVFLWQAVELFVATDAFFGAWDEALRQQGESE